MNAEDIAQQFVSYAENRLIESDKLTLARALLVAIAALEEIYGHGESFEQAQMAEVSLAKIRGESP